MNDDTTLRTNELARQDVPGSSSGLLAPFADEDNLATARVAGEIGLTLVGGLAVGLVIGVLLPRGKRRKVAKKARSLSTLVGELSQALLAQAGDVASESREKLDHLSQVISETVAEQTAAAGKQTKKAAKQAQEASKEASKQAQSMASDAADQLNEAAGQLNDAGKAMARTAIKWVEKLRG